MILPIVAYGSPVLKRKALPISKDHPDLDTLIANMWETMYAANGVGLAAPQIAQPVRLFIVDTAPFAEDESSAKEEDVEFLKTFKKTFINPTIIEEKGAQWEFNEGCLSIPDIRENVNRKTHITLRYCDEDFEEYTHTFSGLAARVIQHEYDHIEGILFTDHLSPLKKRFLKGKLNTITKGNINPEYPMKFPVKNRKR